MMIEDKRQIGENQAHLINLVAKGMSNADVCNLVDITNPSLVIWKKNNCAVIKARRKELQQTINKVYENEITGLANEIVAKGHKVLKCMNEDKLGKASLSALGVTFGILIDKMRLLTNQSTNNIDVRFSNRESALEYLRTVNPDKEVIDV